MNRNLKPQQSPSVWLTFSAGQGPKECGWVVAQLIQRIVCEAQQHNIQAEVFDALAFDKQLRHQNLIRPDALLSANIRLSGTKAHHFAKQWEGGIRWQGDSPYRPKHKRINWFVGVEIVNNDETHGLSLENLAKEVTMETMKSQGPGGQHVNKTQSAVRLTHRPSGLQVRAETDRSQHRNKKIALERLQLLLIQQAHHQRQQTNKERWLQHQRVPRGNSKRCFYGHDFTEQ